MLNMLSHHYRPFKMLQSMWMDWVWMGQCHMKSFFTSGQKVSSGSLIFNKSGPKWSSDWLVEWPYANRSRIVPGDCWSHLPPGITKPFSNKDIIVNPKLGERQKKRVSFHSQYF